MPEVDHFLGTDEVALVADAIAGRTERVRVAETPRYLYDDLAPRRPSMALHTAYVKIAEGCDRPCAFCIIPKLRGPQRSRAPDSVVREAEVLAAAGAREICLVAQDLTTYGRDLPDGRDRRRSQPRAPAGPRWPRSTALRWIRLHYAYPSAVTDELLDVMAARAARSPSTSTCPSSTSTTACSKSMRRGHGVALVRELVERVRARVPGRDPAHDLHRRPPGRDRRPPSSSCATSSARPSSTGSASSPTRARRARWPRCCPKRVPAKEMEARRRELLRIQRQISQEEAARPARPRDRGAGRGPLRRVRVRADGPPLGPGPRDRRPGLPDPHRRPRPRPGDFVRARVTTQRRVRPGRRRGPRGLSAATSPARSSAASPRAAPTRTSSGTVIRRSGGSSRSVS